MFHVYIYAKLITEARGFIISLRKQLRLVIVSK